MTRPSPGGLVVIFAIVVVAAGAWLLAGAPVPGTDESTGDDTAEVAGWPPDPAVVALGRSIYEANCAVCHGANGEGEPDWKVKRADNTYPAPPHGASGHTWHHGDGLLYEIVRDGGGEFDSPTFKSRMPAWGDVLAPDEIVAVVTFLKTLWGPEERAYQAEVSQTQPFPPEAGTESESRSR